MSFVALIIALCCCGLVWLVANTWFAWHNHKKIDELLARRKPNAPRLSVRQVEDMLPRQMERNESMSDDDSAAKKAAMEDVVKRYGVGVLKEGGMNRDQRKYYERQVRYHDYRMRLAQGEPAR